MADEPSIKRRKLDNSGKFAEGDGESQSLSPPSSPNTPNTRSIVMPVALTVSKIEDSLRDPLEYNNPKNHFDLPLFSLCSTALLKRAAEIDIFNNKRKSQWLTDFMKYETMVTVFYSIDWLEVLHPDRREEINNFAKVLRNVVSVISQWIGDKNSDSAPLSDRDFAVPKKNTSDTEHDKFSFLHIGRDMNKWTSETLEHLDKLIEIVTLFPTIYGDEDHYYETHKLDYITSRIALDMSEKFDKEGPSGFEVSELELFKIIKKSFEQGSTFHHIRRNLLCSLIAREGGDIIVDSSGAYDTNGNLTGKSNYTLPTRSIYNTYNLLEYSCYVWDLIHMALSSLLNAQINLSLKNLSDNDRLDDIIVWMAKFSHTINFDAKNNFAFSEINKPYRLYGNKSEQGEYLSKKKTYETISYSKNILDSIKFIDDMFVGFRFNEDEILRLYQLKTLTEALFNIHNRILNDKPLNNELFRVTPSNTIVSLVQLRLPCVTTNIDVYVSNAMETYLNQTLKNESLVITLGDRLNVFGKDATASPFLQDSLVNRTTPIMPTTTTTPTPTPVVKNDGETQSYNKDSMMDVEFSNTSGVWPFNKNQTSGSAKDVSESVTVNFSNVEKAMDELTRGNTIMNALINTQKGNFLPFHNPLQQATYAPLTTKKITDLLTDGYTKAAITKIGGNEPVAGQSIDLYPFQVNDTELIQLTSAYDILFSKNIQKTVPVDRQTILIYYMMLMRLTIKRTLFVIYNKTKNSDCATMLESIGAIHEQGDEVRFENYKKLMLTWCQILVHNLNDLWSFWEDDSNVTGLVEVLDRFTNDKFCQEFKDVMNNIKNKENYDTNIAHAISATSEYLDLLLEKVAVISEDERLRGFGSTEYKTDPKDIASVVINMFRRVSISAYYTISKMVMILEKTMHLLHLIPDLFVLNLSADEVDNGVVLNLGKEITSLFPEFGNDDQEDLKLNTYTKRFCDTKMRACYSKQVFSDSKLCDALTRTFTPLGGYKKFYRAHADNLLIEYQNRVVTEDNIAFKLAASIISLFHPALDLFNFAKEESSAPVEDFALFREAFRTIENTISKTSSNERMKMLENRLEEYGSRILHMHALKIERDNLNKTFEKLYSVNEIYEGRRWNPVLNYSNTATEVIKTKEGKTQSRSFKCLTFDNPVLSNTESSNFELVGSHTDYLHKLFEDRIIIMAHTLKGLNNSNKSVRELCMGSYTGGFGKIIRAPIIEKICMVIGCLSPSVVSILNNEIALRYGSPRWTPIARQILVTLHKIIGGRGYTENRKTLLEYITQMTNRISGEGDNNFKNRVGGYFGESRKDNPNLVLKNDTVPTLTEGLMNASLNSWAFRDIFHGSLSNPVDSTNAGTSHREVIRLRRFDESVSNSTLLAATTPNTGSAVVPKSSQPTQPTPPQPTRVFDPSQLVTTSTIQTNVLVKQDLESTSLEYQVDNEGFRASDAVIAAYGVGTIVSLVYRMYDSYEYFAWKSRKNEIIKKKKDELEKDKKTFKKLHKKANPQADHLDLGLKDAQAKQALFGNGRFTNDELPYLPLTQEQMTSNEYGRLGCDLLRDLPILLLIPGLDKLGEAQTKVLSSCTYAIFGIVVVAAAKVGFSAYNYVYSEPMQTFKRLAFNIEENKKKGKKKGNGKLVKKEANPETDDEKAGVLLSMLRHIWPQIYSGILFTGGVWALEYVTEQVLGSVYTIGSAINTLVVKTLNWSGGHIKSLLKTFYEWKGWNWNESWFAKLTSPDSSSGSTGTTTVVQVVQQNDWITFMQKVSWYSPFIRVGLDLAQLLLNWIISNLPADYKRTIWALRWTIYILNMINDGLIGLDYIVALAPAVEIFLSWALSYTGIVLAAPVLSAISILSVGIILAVFYFGKRH